MSRRHQPTPASKHAASFQELCGAIEYGPCGKYVHATRAAAKRHARRLQTQKDRKYARVYQCERCSGFHVTQQEFIRRAGGN